MFQLFKPLYDFHLKFLMILEIQFQQYKPYKKTFLQLIPFINYFKMYFIYCKKHDEADKMFKSQHEIYLIAKETYKLEDMFYRPV
jgi:predicted GTPase